jgi:hypothetical protein
MQKKKESYTIYRIRDARVQKKRIRDARVQKKRIRDACIFECSVFKEKIAS